MITGRKTQMRALMIHASEYDVQRLLCDWHWIVPVAATPLFLSAFGDWVFAHPDGSLWMLSVLEGTYSQIARDATEYNTLNKSTRWLESTFIANWQAVAARDGMQPGKDECLGWKVHPLMGGEFDVANMQIFSMAVYQKLMGQMHRQLQALPHGARITEVRLDP
jgi:hypothetical protein